VKNENTQTQLWKNRSLVGFLLFAKFFSELPHVEVLLYHDKDQQGILTYLTTGDFFYTWQYRALHNSTASAEAY